MKQHLLTLAFAASAIGAVNAQTRYLDPLFVPQPSELETYGVNLTREVFFLGGQSTEPTLDTLQFRAFTPQNDEATNRPVFIISHTGSYLPPFVNGGLTGSMNDRAVLELASKLAARGYVVVTPENRIGWAASSADIDVQTSTLLLASYRGAQDMQTMARFLRMTVEEQDNPYGIDPNKIAVLGLGTGGYNALNANFLDNTEEVNTLDKLINNTTNEPYLDTLADGDPYAITEATRSRPNHINYPSGFQFAVCAGGGLGDTSWIDGNDIEAPVVAFQSTEDRNAPFGIDNISVPTTGNVVLPTGAGGRVVVEIANRIGLNDTLTALNDSLAEADDIYTLRVNELSDDVFTTVISGYETTLATPNFYPFLEVANTRTANQYNWVDSAVVGPFARGFVASGRSPFTYQQMIDNELRSNPTAFDSTAASLYQDTILAFMLPRAYVAMDLKTDIDVAVTDLKSQDVDLALLPNPASSLTQISVRDDVEIQSVQLLNTTGQVLMNRAARGSRVNLDVTGVRPGLHYVILQTSRGSVASQLLIVNQ